MKPQAPTLDQMKKALAQFRKGTKVKERVYHGTGNLENLASFDPSMTGKGNDQLGSGFYFTTHPDEASGYATSVTPNVEEGTTKLGGNSSPGVVAAHLAIRKPIKIGPQGYSLNDSNVNLSHDQVKRIMEHNPKLRDPEESPLNDHFDTSRGVTSKMIHDVAGYYTGKGTLFMLENDMFKDDPTNYRRALHNVLGYDGVMKDFGDGRKHYVAWFPEQVKSAIGNRGTYDPTNPDITMAKGGEVQPSVAQMKLALNKQGMYSPLEKAALAIPRTKGTPAEFMAEISKQPGFRKEEVEDRKISLPEQKMTKDEFLGHLKNHPAPLLDEKVLKDVDEDEIRDQIANEHYGTDYLGLGYNSGKHVDKMVEEAMKNSTAYGNWQLPGGENYREVLLKLPQQGLSDKERDRKMWLEANQRRGSLTIPEDNELMKLQIKEKRGSQDYHSSHWQDDPNVLAHMRLSDRTGPNGEKILHVEEVQSDWHQQGRKEGYAISQAERQRADELMKMADAAGGVSNLPKNLQDEAKQLGQRLTSSGVPDAPFKKNWHELALKHALSMAAKGGYHGIAITPGEQQAERYDLSKHIDLIRYEPETQNFFAKDKNGQVVHRGHVPPEELPNYVGKDMADKIAAGGEFSGLDIKTGGEGMKGFYDKIVPTFLNKLGKPHGAQVSKINLQTTGMPPSEYDKYPEDHPYRQKNYPSVHYFPITDSMRQQITQEGLPQYDKGGKVDPLSFLNQLQNDEPIDPVGNLKRNVAGAWDVIKEVPGNLKRLATDPVAYIRSLPAPTGEQIMNMAGPGNIGFAGMMIGPKARTWHTGRAQMAEAMETAGRTPEEIWKATGTLKGPDGIWRQEISDKGSTFNMIDDLKLKAQQYKDMIEGKKALLAPDRSGQKDFWPKALTEAKRPVREEIAGLKGDLSEMSRSPRTQGVPARWTLDHPELYAAYPELADLPVVQNYKTGPEKGSLYTSGGKLYNMEVNDPRMPRSIALHEMQHAIQNIEGMTPGANPMMALGKPEWKAMYDAYKKAELEGMPPGSTLPTKVEDQIAQKAAMRWYQRQHGEAEARATQARRDMTDAERAQSFPYNSYDVSPSDFLTRDPIPYTGKVSEARGGSVHPLLPDFEE